MPRARNLKPGFFTNDVLAEVQPLGRILFAGLWCLADREGRLEDRPKKIKAEILPYDNCNVDKLLEDLQGSSFILRYEVNGVRYIQILAFAKHQNPHVREPASIIPAPCEHSASTRQAPEQNGTGPADSLFLDSPSLIPDSIGSTEPQAASAPAAEKLFLNTGDEFPITEDQVSEYEKTYPAVNVRQQLRQMRQWTVDNPAKRKTSRGILRFVNAWLAKEQDKPHVASNGYPRQQGPPQRSYHESSFPREQRAKLCEN